MNVARADTASRDWAGMYHCLWPVVLRTLQETGEYKHLGMAYAYGIVDGEAVRKHKVEGLEDIDFWIV